MRGSMGWLRAALCVLALGCGFSTWGQAEEEAFFFLQMSDPQFGMYTKNGDFQQETANFEFAIATANRLRPRFVIVCGDLVNQAGDTAQIAEYRRISAKLDKSIRMYHVAGNHDVGNQPTPASIAAWKKLFGPDHYSFREGGLYGIVLNSSLIHSPQDAPMEYEEQRDWLAAELGKARSSGAVHTVIFQHHPWFLGAADEADQYFNIPRARRNPLLETFRQSGVRYLFSGHYHRNAVAKDGELEAITTGPVGMPLGDARSGVRLVRVGKESITHEYVEFGSLPNRVSAP
ncbi:MAG TPA: metallophosphoesterase [Bryobacteraceae bacterium]|nr:metallophosphoesterase [Bryobacteraceae bacterium]